MRTTAFQKNYPRIFDADIVFPNCRVLAKCKKTTKLERCGAMKSRPAHG